MGCPCLDLDMERRAKRLPRALSTSKRRLPEELGYRPDALELLLRWGDLRDVIADASSKLADVFGPSAQIVLDRFDDPEAEVEDPLLYLVVRTDLKAGPARAALDRFYEEWWSANEGRTDDHLFVSVEFR